MALAKPCSKSCRPAGIYLALDVRWAAIRWLTQLTSECDSAQLEREPDRLVCEQIEIDCILIFLSLSLSLIELRRLINCILFPIRLFGFRCCCCCCCCVEANLTSIAAQVNSGKHVIYNYKHYQLASCLASQQQLATSKRASRGIADAHDTDFRGTITTGNSKLFFTC